MELWLVLFTCILLFWNEIKKEILEEKKAISFKPM